MAKRVDLRGFRSGLNIQILADNLVGGTHIESLCLILARARPSVNGSPSGDFGVLPIATGPPIYVRSFFSSPARPIPTLGASSSSAA